MSIDTSGKWWVGSAPADIGDYLRAYSDDSYAVHEFRLARCSCGSSEFHLETDDDEGVARRTCASCLRHHYICDSGEYWAESNPVKFDCVECHSDICNVGVGFSLFEDNPAGVRWLYVGERCARCGVLGCSAGWKIGLADALNLLELV